MGALKRMMERHETLCGVAIGIALEARVLRSCEYHDCLFEGPNDIVDAYKLGNSKFTAGTLEGHFQSRREMTDCIKEVVEDNCNDICPRCADLRDE
jgi:hypothetical protein